MANYELTNIQRKYFGLEEVDAHWDKVELKGDKYRPNSILYFEGSTIRKHVISTENKYLESKYNEPTKDRKILLPKTERGKEIKLTAATLEQKSQVDVYLYVDGFGAILIGNYTSQTTFYSSLWEKAQEKISKPIPQSIIEFIADSPQNHLSEISTFKTLTRKHISAKSGDYFRFKLNRTEYGIGRILLDVRKLKKHGIVHSKHGLAYVMTRPLIVQFFAYIADSKNIDILKLNSTPTLPSDLMMDNLLFYGEYEIIGHKKLFDGDFDFPISYGKAIDRREIVFLQWGLIHKELSINEFNKYLIGETPMKTNPFEYYSIGFRPSYSTLDVINTVQNNGNFDFEACHHYRAKNDLRNPKHDAIRREILSIFGLDLDKNYFENSLLAGIDPLTVTLEKLK